MSNEQTQRRCSEQELEEYVTALRAWAAGEEIEYWDTFEERWESRVSPKTHLDPVGQTRYRVKPKPVEVKRWGVFYSDGIFVCTRDSEAEAIVAANLHADMVVVELTGTYTPK